jgi:hypothetical protein
MSVVAMEEAVKSFPYPCGHGRIRQGLMKSWNFHATHIMGSIPPCPQHMGQHRLVGNLDFHSLRIARGYTPSAMAEELFITKVLNKIENLIMSKMCRFQ